MSAFFKLIILDERIVYCDLIPKGLGFRSRLWETVIITGIFRSFAQSLQANAGMGC